MNNPWVLARNIPLTLLPVGPWDGSSRVSMLGWRNVVHMGGTDIGASISYITGHLFARKSTPWNRRDADWVYNRPPLAFESTRAYWPGRFGRNFFYYLGFLLKGRIAIRVWDAIKGYPRRLEYDPIKTRTAFREVQRGANISSLFVQGPWLVSLRSEMSVIGFQFHK